MEPRAKLCSVIAFPVKILFNKHLIEIKGKKIYEGDTSISLKHTVYYDFIELLLVCNKFLFEIFKIIKCLFTFYYIQRHLQRRGVSVIALRWF